MKKTNSFLKVLFLGFLILIVEVSVVSAQNWDKLNPGGIETLVDTALMRAVVVTIQPGEMIGPLTHPAYFAYVLSDGKVKVYHQEGEPSVLDFKIGMSLYSGPEGPHRTENIGGTPVKFLLVELKENPYQAPHKE